MVVGVFDCGLTGRWFESALCRSTLTIPPVVHNWVNKKGLGMSSRVCATWYIKNPVPLIVKVGHQVIIITRLNLSYMTVCSHPEDGLDADRA